MTKTVEPIDSSPAKRNRRRNSIELLPRQADIVIESAKAAILAGRDAGTDIYQTFNRELEVLGFPPVSYSAFNRWSLSVSALVATPNPSALTPYQKIAYALRLLAEAVEQIGGNPPEAA